MLPVSENNTWCITKPFEVVKILEDDYICVCLDGKYGFLDRDNNWVVAPCLDDVSRNWLASTSKVNKIPVRYRGMNCVLDSHFNLVG
jgi:hypothetical protein